MRVQGNNYRTVWYDNGTVQLIDQRVLPHSFEIHSCPDYDTTERAIENMVVRGAGAIGATAGYGLAQAMRNFEGNQWDAFSTHVSAAKKRLSETRPTAQNLFYALDRVHRASMSHQPDVPSAQTAAEKEAAAIADEDAEACRRIGDIARDLIQKHERMLTHCNAGWLAFVDWGSALSGVYAAKRAGANPFVYVDETRPRGQGASLTAWELTNENIDHVVIADNAAGYFFQTGDIRIVIVGADRIAANGDVANKIGTYEKAILAREHGVPFYVAAPLSTIDPNCPSGNDIPIEERAADEVQYVRGETDDGELVRVKVTQSTARNPAFDVTPAALVTGLITPFGIVEPNTRAIQSVLDKHGT